MQLSWPTAIVLTALLGLLAYLAHIDGRVLTALAGGVGVVVASVLPPLIQRVELLEATTLMTTTKAVSS